MIYYIRNSIDGLIGANRDILANNLYAYCSNNAISKKDLNGLKATDVFSVIANAAIKVSKTVIETAKQVQRNEEQKYRYQASSSNEKLSCDVPKRRYSSENSYYCEPAEKDALKVNSVISTGYGADISIETGLTIAGVSILKAGYANQRVNEIVNGQLYCYREERVGLNILVFRNIK